jgi:hypothetical protein
MPHKRKPARNTRRARGRRTNRERPAAPYRTGNTASVRVIPPTGGARTHTYAITREAGPPRRFRFRANGAGVPLPAEPGDSLGRAPGTGPAAAERGAS